MSYASRPLAQRGIPLGVVLDEMRFLTVEKLGPKQSLTPEGFLLIEDTPVGRAGWQIYAPQEIPNAGQFSPPPDGVFRVWRDEKEVFAPEAMASGNGKPIVDEHPDEIVTPDTHEGVPGVALDPRRGEGALDDLLVMDLIVYNKALIQAIRDGKRELSLGYDVDYEEIEPGKLAQKNIRINHVALVDSGRCGPRCSIGDHAQPHAEEVSMARTATKKKVSDVFDALRRALTGSTSLTAKDKEELEKVLKKEEDELPEVLKEHEFKPEHDDDEPVGHHIEVHNHMPAAAAAPGGNPEHDDDEPEGGMEERVSRLETAVHEIAEMVRALKPVEAAPAAGATTDDPVGPDGEAILGQLEMEAPTGAEAVDVRGAKDSRYLVDSFQATAATAEIIAPGIRLPTFDQKGDPKKNFEVICGLRRSALDLAYLRPDTRGMIEEVLGGRTLDVKKMTCDATRSLFGAVGAMKRGANNRSLRVGDGLPEGARETGKPVGKVQNLRDYQAMLNEHYYGKKTA